MDQALKQRLVGATVLIILGVILLPMLLSGQPELANESRRITLPDKPPELSMDKRRFPIGEHAPARPSEVPGQAVAPEEHDIGDAAAVAVPPESTTGGASAGTDPMIAETVEAEPAADAAAVVPVESEPLEVPELEPAKPTPEPGPEDGRYLVQVASFSKSASANELSDNLAGLGLPVVLENVTTEAGRLHRVRVGPFDRTEQAEAAIERIESLKLDLQPRVLDLRPDENAPVTEPSDPLVRWVVQAGVFSSPENAERLVSDLRNQGFSAYSEQVRIAGAVTHKVRIGPVAERRRAEEINADLKRKADIDGRVMSVD